MPRPAPRPSAAAARACNKLHVIGHIQRGRCSASGEPARQVVSTGSRGSRAKLQLTFNSEIKGCSVQGGGKPCYCNKGSQQEARWEGGGFKAGPISNKHIQYLKQIIKELPLHGDVDGAKYGRTPCQNMIFQVQSADCKTPWAHTFAARGCCPISRQ